MPIQGENLLLQTLISAFRDANLGIGCRGLPSVQDETAQSHLFRIMDFCWNTEMCDEISTIAISKEVILTLLQCAARLYEDNAREAVDLIESNHTRAIVSLGIRDIQCWVVHQRCLEGIRWGSLDTRTAGNYSRKADLFSAIRKNKARQLSYQAMIFERISCLCCSHDAALQNAFDSPKIDELFMFNNYVTLLKAFTRDEKTWLSTLLPDTFQWEGRDPCGSADGDGCIGPTTETPRDASSIPNQNIMMSTSLDSVEYHRSLPWGVVCREPGTGNPVSDFEPFTLTSKAPEFNRGKDHPWSRASALRLRLPREVHKVAQKEEIGPVGIHIEGKNAGDYQPEWSERLSPFEDDDWDLPGSSGSENIFSFSPDSHSEVLERAEMSTVLRNADNEHHGHVPSANDVQQLSSQFLPGERMEGPQNKRRLWTIPEELEVVERKSGPETALKLADAALLLGQTHTFHNQDEVKLMKTPKDGRLDEGEAVLLGLERPVAEDP